ncbi:hypothetical protein [Streptomyces griseoaurantiacus]|uniref:hypothetical protein n=1 Tax=Streptomyces griseoaurantiacus TaxID=68213 RepID=UPI003799068C
MTDPRSQARPAVSQPGGLPHPVPPRHVHEHQLIHQMDSVDALLRATSDPSHRRILANFRRHVLLEVAGRHEEILTPEMTVEHPVYRLVEGRANVVLSGTREVLRFYEETSRARANVLWTTGLRPAVADWGFAAEGDFHRQLPGRFLGEEHIGVDDPQATYLVSCRAAFIWPYDPEGRLEGEHVYEDPGTVTVTRMLPHEVISQPRAAQLLNPLIDSGPR